MPHPPLVPWRLFLVFAVGRRQGRLLTISGLLVAGVVFIAPVLDHPFAYPATRSAGQDLIAQVLREARPKDAFQPYSKRPLTLYAVVSVYHCALLTI
jgi:hypothetical protein